MISSKPDDTPSAASGVLVTVDVNSKPSAPTNLCADPERKMWWRSRPCLILASITFTAAIIAFPVAVVTAMNASNSAATPSSVFPG